MSFNLATILKETAAALPDAPVYRAGRATQTYRELDQESGQIDGEPAGWRPARSCRPGT